MVKDIQNLLEKCNSGMFIIPETSVHRKRLKELVYGDEVIDENKSVKWNKEEKQRLIEQHTAALNVVIQRAESSRIEFKNQIWKAISDVYGFNRQQFEKIFNHIAARPEHEHYQIEAYSCALFVEDIVKACDWLYTFEHLA